MTTAASFALEPLILDTSAIEMGIRAFVANRGPVVSYISAIVGVPLGPRPIVIDGVESGSYEPLAKLPDLRGALRDAQNHASSVADHLESLHRSAQAATAFVGVVTAPLIEVLAILDAVPSGGVPTDGQMRQIVDGIGLARMWTAMQSSGLSNIQSGVHDFLSHLVADHDALVHGKASVEDSIAKTTENATNEALKYMQFPGIMNIIVKIGNEVVGALKRLRDALRDALFGHEEMSTGVSALGSAVATMSAKYAAAEDAVGRAGADTMKPVLERLDLRRAIASWEQYAAFMSRSGL